MDRSPRHLAKAIPYLAAALGVESIVALTPPFTGDDFGIFTCLRALIHVPHIALLLGFMIGVLVMGTGGLSRIAAQRLLYGGFVCLAATALGRFVDMDVYTHAPRAWLFLQAGGSLFLSVAAPGIWGCAAAREEDLADQRTPRIARLFAGIVFGGFLSLLGSDLLLAAVDGPLTVLKSASSILGVSSLILLAGRGCLLWSAVDSWRPAADEGVVLDRIHRIQGLMIGWLGASSVSWVLSAFFCREESRGWAGANTLMLLWHAVVQATLSLLVAILVARALERPGAAFQPRPKGRFFPEAPPGGDTSPIDVP